MRKDAPEAQSGGEGSAPSESPPPAGSPPVQASSGVMGAAAQQALSAAFQLLETTAQVAVLSPLHLIGIGAGCVFAGLVVMKLRKKV